jgi:hypothetical protein
MSTGRIIGIILIVGGILTFTLGIMIIIPSIESMQNARQSINDEVTNLTLTSIIGSAAFILGIIFAAKSKKTKE